MGRSATASLDFSSAQSYFWTWMPSAVAIAAAGALVMPKCKGVGLLSQITGLFAGSLPACERDDLTPIHLMIADMVLMLTKEKRLHSALCPA